MFTRRVRDSAVFRGIVTPPQLDRHIHTIPLPRLGGVAIYFSVVLVLVLGLFISRFAGFPHPLSLRSVVGLLVPGTLIFLLGAYDDLRGADAYLKFGVQTCAGLLLYWSGYGIQHFDLISSSAVLSTALGLPLTIFWVLLITNAFNLIDGLDGLAAGSAFFSTIVIFAISLLRHNTLVSLIAVVLAGAILGFLRFNFNPATIFLGDSGSLFIGFVLAALALVGSQKGTTMVTVAIPIVAFGLPILDVVLAVSRRLIGERPLFDGDHDHIHHRLLKRGFSHRGAVLVLYAATAAFSLLSVALLHGEKMLALVLVCVAVGVLLGVQQLRYVEFSELNGVLNAVFKKRIVANNVSIRRAAEQLDSCEDRETFCQILRDTLQPLGFSGFRLENFLDRRLPDSSILPLCYDSKGSIQFCWMHQNCADPNWELRLQLTTRAGRHLGYLCLFQIREDRRQSFDLSVMTDGVRTSISNALQRTLPQISDSAAVSSDGGSAGEQDRENPGKPSPALSRAARPD